MSKVSRDMVSSFRNTSGRNTGKFGLGHGHDLADFDAYHKVRGLRWPVVDGKETLWRFNAEYDPYARKENYGKFAFYGKLRKGDPKG